jgi:hypothetical protein
VDWISSLSDRTEEEPEPEKIRRRLRRDNDLDAPADIPEPPTWPANDSSYVSPDYPTQKGS